MAKLNDVKKHMNDVASLLASQEAGEKAALPDAAKQHEQQEQARASRVQMLVQKVVLPKVEAFGAALGLVRLKLDDTVLSMRSAEALSPEETASVLSMRCVRLTFELPFGKGARCALTIGQHPDDSVSVYSNGQKCGTINAGPLDSDAAYAKLAADFEELLGDAMMSIVSGGLPS